MDEAKKQRTYDSLRPGAIWLVPGCAAWLAVFVAYDNTLNDDKLISITWLKLFVIDERYRTDTYFDEHVLAMQWIHEPVIIMDPTP